MSSSNPSCNSRLTQEASDIMRQLQKLSKELNPVKSALTALKKREMSHPNPSAAAASIDKIAARISSVNDRYAPFIHRLNVILNNELPEMFTTTPLLNVSADELEKEINLSNKALNERPNQKESVYDHFRTNSTNDVCNSDNNTSDALVEEEQGEAKNTNRNEESRAKESHLRILSDVCATDVPFIVNAENYREFSETLQMRVDMVEYLIETNRITLARHVAKQYHLPRMWFPELFIDDNKTIKPHKKKEEKNSSSKTAKEMDSGDYCTMEEINVAREQKTQKQTLTTKRLPKKFATEQQRMQFESMMDMLECMPKWAYSTLPPDIRWYALAARQEKYWADSPTFEEVLAHIKKEETPPPSYEESCGATFPTLFHGVNQLNMFNNPYQQQQQQQQEQQLQWEWQQWEWQYQQQQQQQQQQHYQYHYQQYHQQNPFPIQQWEYQQWPQYQWQHQQELQWQWQQQQQQQQQLQQQQMMFFPPQSMPNPGIPDRLININVNAPLPPLNKINEAQLHNDAERKAKRRAARLRQHQRKELLLKHNYSILPNLVTRILSTAMLLKDEYIDRIILERTALLDAVGVQEKEQEEQQEEVVVDDETQTAHKAVDTNERKPVFTASSYSSPVTYNRSERASSSSSSSQNNNNNNNNRNSVNDNPITSRSSFSEITSAIFNRTMNLTRYGFSSAEINNNNSNSASNRNNNNNNNRNANSNANALRSHNNTHNNNESNNNATNNPDAVRYNFTSSLPLVEASQDEKRAFEMEISGRIAKLTHANLLSQSDSASFDAAMMNVIEELFAESLHLQPSSVNKQSYNSNNKINYDDAEPARKARSLEMNMANDTNVAHQNAFAKENINAWRIALSPDELRAAEDNWSNSILLIKRPTRYYCLWTGAVMGGSASVDRSFPLALRNGSIISNQFILQHKPSVKHMTALQVAKPIDTQNANDQRTNNNNNSILGNLSEEIISSLSHALEAELNTHALNSSTMNALGIHRVFVT